MEEQEERCIQSHHASATSDDDDEYCYFTEKTEIGSICLEEGTHLGDTRQETQHRKSECVVYI